MTEKEINDFFRFIEVKDGADSNNVTAEEIRELAKQLSLKIQSVIPDGSDKSRMLNKLREVALMAIHLINSELSQNQEVWEQVTVRLEEA